MDLMIRPWVFYVNHLYMFDILLDCFLAEFAPPVDALLCSLFEDFVQFLPILLAFGPGEDGIYALIIVLFDMDQEYLG